MVVVVDDFLLVPVVVVVWLDGWLRVTLIWDFLRMTRGIDETVVRWV